MGTMSPDFTKEKRVIIGEKLKQWRMQANLTCDEIGSKTNHTRQSIYAWEAGVAMPSIYDIYLLSKVYNNPDLLRDLFDTDEEVEKRIQQKTELAGMLQGRIGNTSISSADAEALINNENKISEQLRKIRSQTKGVIVPIYDLDNIKQTNMSVASDAVDAVISYNSEILKTMCEKLAEDNRRVIRETERAGCRRYREPTALPRRSVDRNNEMLQRSYAEQVDELKEMMFKLHEEIVSRDLKIIEEAKAEVNAMLAQNEEANKKAQTESPKKKCAVAG